MREMLGDVRHAMRRLRRSPGFTATALLTVALGVGATTAMFSAVHGVLLKPLPYPEPERLVMIRGASKAAPGRPGVISYPDYLDWKRQARSFEALAALLPIDLALAAPAGPERLAGARVTASFFTVLRMRPALGRLFTEEADRPGGERVVVVADALWRRLGADPALVGATLTLDGEACTVVGVLPAGFRPPREIEHAEVFGPLALEGGGLEERGNRFLVAIGRLRSSVSVAAARADLAQVALRLEKEHPDDDTGAGTMVDSLHADTVGDLRRPLLVLMGAVAFLLLIACTNTANLVLPRALARTREVAVRAALGADRSRLVRELLTESLLLGLLGGAAGVALAYFGLDALVVLAPREMPRLQDVALDGRVLAFSLTLSLLTGVAFGLVPALSASRADLRAALHESGRTPGLARHRGAQSLVVAEIALSLVLLVGAGLLLESFRRLLSVDPGFDPRGVLTMATSLPPARYPRPEQKARFYAEIVERLRARPGVLSAAATTALPVGSGSTIATRFTVEGRPAPSPGQKPRAEFNAVTYGYFRTMRIPVRKGRVFADTDRRESPAVAVVNEALAAAVFPGEDPLGRRLRVGVATGEGDPDTFEIVGVVGDVRPFGWTRPVEPQIYVPHAQQSWPFMSLVVRTSGDPGSLAGLVRRELAALDPEQPARDVRPLSALGHDALAPSRFVLALLGAFALLGLALATVGVYGVVSGSVEGRTGEIGLRLAVGADPRDVLGMVMGQAGRLAAAGVGLGLLAAFGLTRAMQALLFGVSATDPRTFAAVAAVLAASTLLASYLPARRASRTDPARVLREE
jgi:putative ABC transport system permease protein